MFSLLKAMDLPTSNVLRQRLNVWSAAATDLPTGKDYAYHSAFRGFPRQMRTHAVDAVEVAEQVSNAHLGSRRDRPVLTAATTHLTSSASAATTKAATAALHAAVMDTIDLFLEDVDHLLDEARGERLAADKQNQLDFGSAAVGSTAHDFTSKVTRSLRPQLHFGGTALDNSVEQRWRPWYRDESGTVFAEPGTNPLQKTIEAVKLCQRQITAGTAAVYPALESTPLHFIDNEDSLDQMIIKLKGLSEIAVDLEAHSYHSFQGFTCLMQISTRTDDFIIDTLALRAALPRLAVVFHDPATVKVLHGAQEDVRWLQRDFGLFVVNLFDTGIALQTLKRPRGLAFLVDHFCQITLDKTYQTADWRVRPLPGAMVHYARQDTHYLLYCYDRLRATLLQAPATGAIGNLLVHVWAESKKLSLTVYEKPTYDPQTSWAEALGKGIAGLNAAQLEAAKSLHNWREVVAREEDESLPAVLTNATLVALATRLPTSSRDVLRVAQPASVFLRKHVAHIAEILQVALRSDVAAAKSLATVVDDDAAPSTTQTKKPLAVHRPMTGTLPSVAGGVSIVDLQYIVENSTVKRGRTAAEFFGTPLFRARVEVPLPIPTLPCAPSLTSTHVPRTTEAADASSAAQVVTADSDDVASHGSGDVETAGVSGFGDEVALPPSVIEQYGGLGRHSRRREKRQQRRE